MDLKDLKLELLERIALLDDDVLLHAVKRLLDAPRGYGIPNENLSVVKEGQQPYLHIEDRTYTGEEVRRLFDDLRSALEREGAGTDEAEVALLDARRARHLKGEGRSYTVEEMLALLKKDLGA